MPVKNRFAELHDDITAWRRDLHENPEILFETHRTSATVAEKLRSFGCDEVVEGIGRTGVVGVIKGKETGSGKVIGLRGTANRITSIAAPFLMGTIAQLIIGAAVGSAVLGTQESWVTFLSGAGAIVLTFLAGAELQLLDFFGEGAFAGALN